jgi:hypothetical protein
MKPTYTTNSPISFPYPSINFKNANCEVLRITHDGRMIMGEGLSTEEATQVAAKMLIDAFEEQIQKMLDARAAAELAAAKKDLAIAHDGLDERDRLRDHVKRLMKEIHVDTERLDWLSTQQRVAYDNGTWLRSHLGQHPTRTLRATIDADMKETINE